MVRDLNVYEIYPYKYLILLKNDIIHAISLVDLWSHDSQQLVILVYSMCRIVD